MALDHYAWGQPVRLRAEFVDSESNPADPEEIKLTVKPPRGDLMEVEGVDLVDDPGTGKFSLVVLPEEAGDWNWEWAAAEPFVARAPGVFHVAMRNV